MYCLNATHYMHQCSNSGLQLPRRLSVMAEGRRNDNKRKIEALEEEVQKVRELAEKTAQDQAGLRRRMDALDKCTLLVVENSVKLEELYKTATETRNFKTLSKDAAEAVLKELAQLMKLPSPLPDNTPGMAPADSRDNGYRCRLGPQMVETKRGTDPSSQVRNSQQGTFHQR